MKKYFVIALLLALVLPAVAPAQTAVSGTVNVPVSLTLGESVSLALSTSSITLTTVQPSANVVLNTSWVLQPGIHNSGTIYTYFSVIPTGPSGGLNGTNFTSQYNNGAAVTCDHPAFGSGLGIGGMDCGSYSLSNNFQTDINDTASVALTMTFVDPTHAIPVGTFSSGVLNVVFQVV